MKKISFIFLLFLLVFMPIDSLAQQTSSPISIDGKLVEFNTTTGFPFLDENNRTQVPFRIALEAFGAKVDWQQSTRTAIAEKDGIKVEVQIGAKYILRNGTKIENDTIALIVDGKTYLPIRKVMEAFGATVEWDSNNKTVEITSRKDKNIYTSEYLENLVATTEAKTDVLEFRKKDNPRRKGLLKVEGKYFDMYYPDDDYGRETVKLLAPHMDKTYMMLTDIYGLQARVEVHLIHEKDALTLKEGDIRRTERVTCVLLEPYNDANGNNLSEFVHEVSHNFFDEANGGSTNTMWINEANAKYIPSLYMKYNYDGNADMWSFYQLDMLAKELNQLFNRDGSVMTLEKANKILKEAQAWSKAEGEKNLAQRYGLYTWSFVYNNLSLEDYKQLLRNLGTGDVLEKIKEYTNIRIEDITELINSDIKSRSNF